ncbi:MAG TPA: hypothetical protein VHE33_18145 [Acidobacteriaceae bacterium]|nr:hypothetical protein [Acidobacteriaceae bacterium]
MKSSLLLGLLFLLLPGARVSSASAPNALRNRISHDTVIQGYPCARGETWFYPDGSLNQCRLSHSATLGDLRVPGGSLVEFWSNGAAHYLMLQRPAVLAGHKVRGGTRWGLSRGATTTFYGTGELRSFYLVRNESVQNVPCRGGSWNTYTDPTGGQTVVELYRDGSLASCKLSRDYAGFRSGQRIILPHLTVEADNKSIPAQ